MSMCKRRCQATDDECIGRIGGAHHANPRPSNTDDNDDRSCPSGMLSELIGSATCSACTGQADQLQGGTDAHDVGQGGGPRPHPKETMPYNAPASQKQSATSNVELVGSPPS